MNNKKITERENQILLDTKPEEDEIAIPKLHEGILDIDGDKVIEQTIKQGQGEQEQQSEQTEHPAVRMLKAIYRNCRESYVCLTFNGKKSTNIEWIDLGEDGYLDVALPELLKKYSDCNCWFRPSIGQRKEKGGLQKQDIEKLPSLWVDIDKGTAEVWDKIEACPFKPNIWVQTSSPINVQLQWVLRGLFNSEKIYDFETVLRLLADYFGGDMNSAEACHNLRLPSTYNIKYDPPLPVTLLELDDGEYDFEEIQNWLIKQGATDKKPKKSNTNDKGFERKPEGWEQELLGEIKEGEGRNVALTQLAGRYVGKGLSRAEILLTLLGVNSKYNPPLDREDVERILDSVIKGHEGRHPGSKVKEIPEDYEAEILEMFKDGWDDAGIGKIFGRLFSGEFCYIDELKSWHRFGGVNWISDTHEAELRMVETVDIIHDLHYQKEKTKPQPDFKRFAQWHHTFRGDYKIRACLNQAENHLYKSVKLFDTDPWLLVCANGVVDLKTGTFRNATPEDMFLKNTGVVYSPDAQCPIWLKSLNDIFEGNQDLIDYLKRAIGYSLTGSVREDKFFLCEGSGSNGKTTLLEILRELLGSYATEIPFEILEVNFKKTGLEATPDIAKLAGIRVVKSSETKEHTRFNVGRLKSFTGRDTLSARFLHKNPFDFSPTHKLWLSVNHLPRVDDDSYAMWRRVHRIPFRVKFIEPEKAVEGDKVADGDLQTKMKSELSGILNWAIQGCLDWQSRNGMYAPKEVTEATEEYRKESDVISRFLDDEVVREEGNFETMDSLFKTYIRWCGKNGERPQNKSHFGRKLSEKGYKLDRKGSKRIRGVLGIELINPVKDYETAEDAVDLYRDRDVD